MNMSVYTDGGSRNNPGPSSVAAIFMEEGIVIDSFAGYIGLQTNNTAEYRAILESLEFINKYYKSLRGVVFYSDSNLVVQQLNGYFKVKNSTLMELRINILEIIHTLSFPVVFTYIPRTENQSADALVNLVLDTR